MRHKKQDISTSSHGEGIVRARPKIDKGDDGTLQMTCATNNELRNLVGVKTDDAALGLFNSAVHRAWQWWRGLPTDDERHFRRDRAT